jgi:hypothetical protein
MIYYYEHGKGRAIRYRGLNMPGDLGGITRVSKSGKKARLSGTEQQYIQDSSGFTGELARAGLFLGPE